MVQARGIDLGNRRGDQRIHVPIRIRKLVRTAAGFLADLPRRTGKFILQRVGRESREMRMSHGVRAESDPRFRAGPGAPSSGEAAGIRGSVLPCPRHWFDHDLARHDEDSSRQAVLFNQGATSLPKLTKRIVEGQRYCVLARRSPQQRLEASPLGPRPRRQPTPLVGGTPRATPKSAIPRSRVEW